MLGVFGCVPAFDTYFTTGFKVNRFNRDSLSKIAGFYAENRDVIDDNCLPTLHFISGESTERFYTRAKVVDMVFFIEGVRRNLSTFVDYVALAFHEARKVRYLVTAEHLPVAVWEKLISLPDNCDNAWHEIQPTRKAAKEELAASDVVDRFKECFGVSLTDLVSLYSNPSWGLMRFCDGAWLQSTQCLSKLASTWEQRSRRETNQLLNSLPKFRINGGTLVEKLKKLDRSILSKLD